MRYGKPTEVAGVRTPNARRILRKPSPSRAGELRAERPHDSALTTNDPENLAERMSRSLWSSVNPGYILQEPHKLRSVSSGDYTWDGEEVTSQRSHNALQMQALTEDCI